MIVITLPHIIEGETETLLKLQNIDPSLIIHIRKPDSTSQQLDHLLEALLHNGADMGRLTIHHDRNLAQKYALGGIHMKLSELNAQDVMELSMVSNGFLGGDRQGSAHRNIRISASAHTWEEVERHSSDVDYLFLSPIFDSISKIGYGSKIDLQQAYERLSRRNAPRNIVALGGVDSKRMCQVHKSGFCCGAVLGALWAYDKNRIDIDVTINRFSTLLRRERSAKSRLQFISDGDLKLAEQFLLGGGRWIQLRMKDSSPMDIIERGRLMLSLCNRYEALLIINDSPHIAKEVNAHGVHLGLSDMSPPQARALLGDGAIIGSTANTFEDIESLCLMPIDYIGLGPYRFTTTKSNLSPILGLDGYKSIIDNMWSSSIHIPIFAIGGIDSADVEAIMKCGVSGLAVSGAISNAIDVRLKTEAILKLQTI